MTFLQHPAAAQVQGWVHQISCFFARVAGRSQGEKKINGGKLTGIVTLKNFISLFITLFNICPERQ